MLLQQWAGRYILVTQQPWLTPCQRARVREIFFNYTRGPHIFWGVTPMAFFIYLSIILYMVGGLVYLFNTNRAVFGSLSFWAAMVAIISFLYTAASIFKPQMLFYAPISPMVMRICLGLWYTVLQASSFIPPLHRLCDDSRRRYLDLSLRYHEGLLKGKCKAVEEAASKRSSEIDPVVLEQTFNYMVEDAARQTFFGAIPGFFDSKLVNNLQGRLSNRFRTKFRWALNGFLDHTFSSSTFTKLVRGERLVICLNAARVVLGSGAVSHILDNIFDGRWAGALQYIEVGHALKRWGDTQFSSQIRRIVARIVSRIQVSERDDRWIALVQDEFGVPDRALQDQVSPCDGDSLAILTHIIRQLLRTNSPPWDPDILRGFGNLNIHNTLLSQQQDFCTTWNEIVREAQCLGAGSTPVLVLKEIEHIHAALHQGTRKAAPGPYSGSIAGDDAILLDPLSYPFCRVVDRRLDLTADPHVAKGPAGGASLSFSTSHEVPDLMPFPTPILTPPRPVPLEGLSTTGLPDAAAAVATAKISTLSYTSNTILRPTFDGEPALQQAQETVIPIPPFIGFGSSPTPTPTSTPSLSSRTIHSLLPTSMDTTPSRTDYIAHTLGTSSLSSNDACLPAVPPQTSTFLDQSVGVVVGGADTHNGTRDLNRPISLEVHRHPRKSAASAASIDTDTHPDIQHGTS
jgi:hypothetical protein